MGNQFSACQDEEQIKQANIPKRTDSIFRDMENTSNLRKRFGWENEFNIGPYFQNNNNNMNKGDDEKENQKKATKWKNLADKSNKNRNSIQKPSNNKFIANKIDIMMYEIRQIDQKKFLENVLKGPPAPLRWGSWKVLLQENVTFETGQYERLIEKLEDNPWFLQLSVDISRSFSNQYYFSHSGEQGKSLGHEQLHRVLGAVCKYFPDTYLQSMSFILGFLILISGGSEIEVFWSYVSLVQNPKFMIIGLYEEGMPLLMFLEWLTYKMMAKHCPDILNTFQDLNVPNLFWILKWYSTMYIYSFPINICVRIWDFVLVEGVFGLMYIIIPILKNFEEYLASMDDLEQMEYFQNITRQEKMVGNKDSEYYMDMDKIIKQAQKLVLSKSDIVKYAKQYLQENQHIENKYAELYTKYDKKKEFQRLVEEFMASKIYNHGSRQSNLEKSGFFKENKPNLETEEIQTDYTEIKNESNQISEQLENNSQKQQ